MALLSGTAPDLSSIIQNGTYPHVLKAIKMSDSVVLKYFIQNLSSQNKQNVTN